MNRQRKPILFQWVCGIILSGLLLAGAVEAASVYQCSSHGERCVIRLEDGMPGDQVKILDVKARVIASGTIVKRRAQFALVKVEQTSQEIRRGYPVIVDTKNRSRSIQWASSFTNQE